MLQPSVKFKKVGPRRPPQALWKSYVQVSLAAFAAALLVRAWVVQAYRIPSSSMEDTLHPGDFVLVNKLAYGDEHSPQIGDVIVFAYPLNPDRDFVKRVIAQAGQEVALRNKRLFVDGREVPLPPGGKNIARDTISSMFSNRDNFGPVVVPQASYFVLGDNRDDSEDSRFWGTVPKDHVKGRVMWVYWSWAPVEGEPVWEFPYVHSFFASLAFNLTHLGERLRLDRIGTAIR